MALAGIAALVAMAFGQFMVGAVLLAGVAVHGLGWLYLYKQKSTGRPLGERPGD